MNPVTLYKINGDDNCTILLNIVRYLYTKGFDIRAKIIVERNFPSFVTEFPTLIMSDGNILGGLNAIVKYYENQTNIEHLIEKSTLFDQLNPDYRITLPHTHKNLKNVV